MKRNNSTAGPLKVALVVPHIFIFREIMNDVIFSPGVLALRLAKNLVKFDIDVTLLTPGPAETDEKNITADMSGFERELKNRGYGYIELLKKHPLVFVNLARQVQAEIIARAYEMANQGDFDVVHVYTNEEDIALHFARFCRMPVVFTHHDPYNFLIKYKAVFPHYKHLNYISMSQAQRQDMPPDTNWVANIYHGADPDEFKPSYKKGEYFAYMGRIIEPKGVDRAISAVKLYNRNHPDASVKLKIAGKHYAGYGKDDYWREKIEPNLNEHIKYVGFINGSEKAEFLRQACALLMPSRFAEPFGMAAIEALACGTPVIGSSAGAIPEIVRASKNGYIADTPEEISKAMEEIDRIDRRVCRRDFEERFTLERMAREHAELYRKMTS